MTEKDLWKHLRQHWSPKAHCVRIENVASFGDPDINICYEGREFWIETKIEIGGYIIIRPTQLAWIMKHHQALGHIFLLVGCRKTTFANFYNTKELFQPNILKEIAGQIKVDLNNLQLMYEGKLTSRLFWEESLLGISSYIKGV